MSAKITVEKVSFYYDEYQALRDVNLFVRPHTITAIIGPSGCGKSTLLRVLNRIYDLYPDQRATGRVMLEGRNILDGKVDLQTLRKRVGMVFQKPTPFPMSIFDNVAYGIRLHESLSRKALAARVEEALRQAALWDEVKDALRHSGLGLSGGQQQRLCIARALAVQPDVLLLDEPTSALDPVSTAKIERLISELKTRYTIILVTHNLQQAARIADDTVFMYLGELIESGPSVRMFSSPTDPRTRDYVQGRFG
ncbi:MAG: phosphate ABC transporter ATP-binding protein PstB [Bdellovibrionales bacterium]